MTFDKTQPTDTTKLRNLGIVIRPNWEAIQSADLSFIPEALNLANRTPLAADNDPTANDDTFILYSKDDGAGNQQIYSRSPSPSSNIIQLTAGAPTATDDGTSYLPGGIIIKWGADSATPAGNPVSFPINFPNACWEVIITPTGSTGRAASIDNKLVGGFTAYATNSVSIGYIAIGN